MKLKIIENVNLKLPLPFSLSPPHFPETRRILLFFLKKGKLLQYFFIMMVLGFLFYSKKTQKRVGEERTSELLKTVLKHKQDTLPTAEGLRTG